MPDNLFTFLAISEDGTSHEHHTRLRTGSVDDLLRRAVGGWLELIPIATARLYAWCDEDGPSKNLRTNPVGSLLIARLGGGQLPLVGPIALTGRRGTTATSLTTDQIDALMAMLRQVR